MKQYWQTADGSILKSMPNPDQSTYENRIKGTEITFLGVDEQPDFATVYIDFYAKEKVIELKSLKKYFYQYRNIIISYERLINVAYNHLIETYDPARLRITMEFNGRGGFASKLTIDSDWFVRGEILILK
jgi:7-cyano-7-deazaguanine reductase